MADNLILEDHSSSSLSAHEHHLSWFRHTQNLVKDIQTLFRAGTFCDVNLQVRKNGNGPSRSFQAHKVILSSASPVLKSELSKNVRQTDFALQGDPESFDRVLDFIYSGVLKYEERQTLSIRRWAHDLAMPKLGQVLKDPGYAHCQACQEDFQEGLAFGDTTDGDGNLFVDNSVLGLEGASVKQYKEEAMSEGEGDDSVWSDNALIMMPELILEEGDNMGLRPKEEVKVKKEKKVNDQDEKRLQFEKIRIEKKKKKKTAQPAGVKKPYNWEHKDYLCSLCGRTLRGLTGYKRHLVIHDIFPFFDPPGPVLIGGHYFHAWCPYVRTSQKQVPTLIDDKAKYTITLNGAWWVTKFAKIVILSLDNDYNYLYNLGNAHWSSTFSM